MILNEAADRDVLVAFVGKPHRVDDRGGQVVKSLKTFGFEHYVQAEEMGWVLYLEGSTDLAILQAFAALLDHPVGERLQRPFVQYVANLPRRAQEHFYAVREAKADLVGIALFDRLEQPPPTDPNLPFLVWQKREIENYLCQSQTLLAYAGSLGAEQQDRKRRELFAAHWRKEMENAIVRIEGALSALGKPSPWGPDIKASEDFLDPLFNDFYRQLKLPNLMRKTDYHKLAAYVPAPLLDPEVGEKLDAILRAAQQARPRE